MLSQGRLKAVRGDTPDSYDVLSDSGLDDRALATADDDDLEGGPTSDGEHEIRGDGQDKEEDVDVFQSDPSPPPEYELGAISFGALARAQASHFGVSSKKRKRPTSDAHADHISSHPAALDDHSAEALERKSGKKDDRRHLRLTKHAPAEISSKKAVSRKRSVVPVPKRETRDPRFESALGPINEQKVKSNYAFLDEYRDREWKTLKAELKKTKNKEEREELKGDILRRESRKKAQEQKDAEQEVLRRHRKEERAKIEGGKAPFYLKSAAVKKEALVDRFKKMKRKEVDKVVERRRKKKAGREKKSMPRLRRFSMN